jgi:hypothetical protein
MRSYPKIAYSQNRLSKAHTVPNGRLPPDGRCERQRQREDSTNRQWLQFVLSHQWHGDAID